MPVIIWVHKLYLGLGNKFAKICFVLKTLLGRLKIEKILVINWLFNSSNSIFNTEKKYFQLFVLQNKLFHLFVFIRKNVIPNYLQATESYGLWGIQ